jgi:hypothetical protein
MSRDARRCISPVFGPPRGEVAVDADDVVSLFKTVFINDPAAAAASTLREAYPELLDRCGDDETAILYWPWFREFLIPILDGGPAAVVIDYDPFSGSRLPGSLRDAWFDNLDAVLGREASLFGDDIPQDFRGEAWWIARGL